MAYTDDEVLARNDQPVQTRLDSVTGRHIQKVILYTADGLPAAYELATDSFKVRSTRLVPGVTATDLGKAEDAPHATGDTGVMVLGVRNDGGAALVATPGDYIPLGTDSLGRLWVRVAADDSGSPGDNDDGGVASGQTGIALGLNLGYGWDGGSTWTRIRSTFGAQWNMPLASQGTPNYGQTTIATTATGTVIRSATVARSRITIVNHGTTDVFLGFSTALTAGNGLLLTGVKGTALVFETASQIRGIVAAGTQVVSWAEEIVA